VQVSCWQPSERQSCCSPIHSLRQSKSRATTLVPNQLGLWRTGGEFVWKLTRHLAYLTQQGFYARRVYCSRPLALFESLRVSPNRYSDRVRRTSRVELSGLSPALPHERTTWRAGSTSSLRSSCCSSAFGLVHSALFAPHPTRRSKVDRFTSQHRQAIHPSRLGRGGTAQAHSRLAAIIAYIISNFLPLFGLANHPFDMGAERLWACIARREVRYCSTAFSQNLDTDPSAGMGGSIRYRISPGLLSLALF